MSFLKEQLEQTKRHPFLFVIGTLLLVSLIWIFLRGSNDSAAQKREARAIAVETDVVRKASISRRITVLGTLVANQSVVIKPQVGGVISAIKVEGGKEVAAGDPIMTIDDRAFQAQLKEAEARLILAQAEFGRADKLAGQKFGPVKLRDKTQSDLKAAEAAIDIARKRIEDSVIKAPFEGAISINRISVGAPVNEQTELLTIVDMDPMKVDFRVPAQFIRYLSVGQKLKVVVDGFEKPFDGTVEAIDSTVDPMAHSLAVRAAISNEKRLLRPGIFARVELTAGSKDDALVVPLGALLTIGESDYVYRVLNGVAQRFPVTTGIEEGGNIEIVRGLTAGDLVITVGQSKVRDGVPVTYAGAEANGGGEGLMSSLLSSLKPGAAGGDAPAAKPEPTEQKTVAK